jgi:hypothetical protein
MTGVPQEHTSNEDIVEQKYWRFPECRALPIASVRLEAAGQIYEKNVGNKAQAASFDITLKRGAANIRATFLNESSGVISGAYFVDARRVD